MSGKTRAQARTSQGALNLYPADISNGWRVIRIVSFALGLEKVARGEWTLVNDEQGNPFYFQVKTNFKTDQDLPSGASSASITLGEVLRNAGLFGKSRTAGMTEDARLSRPRLPNGHAPAPEDAIERAQEKVKQWPFPASRVDDGSGTPVFGDRACRVYPKTK